MRTDYQTRAEFSKGTMPARNKKNFRPTKAGAGMTRAGVKAYRRLNPGSKLKTAVMEVLKKQKIKKVMKGLQKASKTHAAQAKTLKGVIHGGSKKRNRKKA